MNTWQFGEWVVLRPLWLIPALLLLLAALLLRHHTARSHWQQVLSPPLFEFLGAAPARFSRINVALLIASLVALSLSQPVVRQSEDETWRHSTGWIVVADVSRSMTLNDTVPTRLSALRESVAELSRQAGARPMALILFAGDAFLVAPPAFDRSVLNEHAALLEYGVIPTEGSNLARALSLATSVIEDSQFIAARVFVLGDSGGIGNSSIAAARYLADAGHRVDGLLFGSSDTSNREIAAVTENNAAIESWSSTTSTGDETRLNWKLAQTLSDNGNGVSIKANRFGVLNYAHLQLDQQANAATHAQLKSLVWRDQSHWLLVFAIPLMLWLFRQELDG